MKLPFWVRRAHRWMGLLIGVQALLWMISGVYMTVISLDIIHGDHLAHVDEEPLRTGQGRIDLAQVAHHHPGFDSLKLKNFLGKEVYEIGVGPQTHLIDARSGARISPIGRELILERAREIYQGEAGVREVSWITEAPQEVASRAMFAPMWAVRFDDRANSTLYFSPHSGELLARRHDLWRWFDFLWMLHIMDYDTRTDVNNTLLRVAAGVGLIFALSGAWLVFYSLRRRTTP